MEPGQAPASCPHQGLCTNACRSRQTPQLLLGCPCVYMLPGAACKVVGLRQYSQMRPCPVASLPPGTQTDTSLFSESWTQDKDMRLSLTGLWPGRVWGLPKARLAPWRCLTQSGRAPQVGTRWQRSRKTLMTITQGCRPLALAFGGRSTWEAPGSSEHVAGVGQGAMHGAKGAGLSRGSEPGWRSHAGSGGIEGLQWDQASLLGCGRQLEADSTPKWPSLSPSASQWGQSGGHPFQAPNPIGQEVTSIMMVSTG